METWLQLLTSLQQTRPTRSSAGPGAPSQGLWKRYPLFVTTAVEVKTGEREMWAIQSQPGYRFWSWSHDFALFDDTLSYFNLLGFSTLNEGKGFHSVHYSVSKMEQRTLEEAMTPSLTWPLSSLWPDLSLPSSFQRIASWLMFTPVSVHSNERQLFQGKLLFLHQYRTHWALTQRTLESLTRWPPLTVCPSEKLKCQVKEILE